jgi:hypothetical protein
MPKLNKKIAIAAAAVAVVAIGGGTAFAYWTTTGSGTGSAATGTSASTLIVHQLSSNAGLVPGGSTNLTGNIENNSTSSTVAHAVTASVTPFDVAVGSLHCTQADFTITGTSTVDPAVIAAHGTGGAWSGLTLNMTDTSANQDACQNVTVPITYAAS